MSAWSNDIRFGWRQLAKNRSATILSITALALAVGASTTVFSIIYNVLLRPFPYTDANRLLLFTVHDAAREDVLGRSTYAPQEWLDYRQQSRAFDQVAGTVFEYVIYQNGQEVHQLYASYVTNNLFDVLGVRPLIGRLPTRADERSDAPPVFVLGYKLWQRLFSGDARVVGRTFVLNGVPRTCIGVMPEHFAFWQSDLWIPVVMDPGNPEVQLRKFFFIGHLKRGISAAAAGADMQRVAAQEASVFPKDYPKPFVIQPMTLVEWAVGDLRGMFWLLFAAVVLLLLIACANIANLLLAQATARDREMAIRVSLGASRFQIVRQLLIESSLLSAAGGIVGCTLAYIFLTRLSSLIPPNTVPEEAVIHLNVTVLVICLAITALTAVLCGLAPAGRVQRAQAAELLRDSGGTHTGKRSHQYTRNLLVVAEVSFSIILMVAGGVLLRSFFRLRAVDVGFDTHRLLAARLPLPKKQYFSKGQVNPFFENLLQRLNHVPGVEAAAEISSLPPYPGFSGEIDIPGKSHGEEWSATLELASANCFRTLGLAMIEGRTFTEAEVEGQRKVAVVNQAFKKRYFGNEDPLGRSVNLIQLGKLADAVSDPVFQIVGVVPDFKNQGIEEPVAPEVFVPYTVSSTISRGILIRTQMNPAALIDAVRKEVWAVDPHVMLGVSGTLDQIVSDISYAAPAFGFTLTTVFAMVGLALAAIGVYSVISYSVSNQTRNIGIRMALGARRGTVMRSVMGAGLSLVVIGSAVGVGVSYAAAQLVSARIYKIPALDFWNLGGATALLLLVAAAACYLPARRATRIDPLAAVRRQ